MTQVSDAHVQAIRQKALDRFQAKFHYEPTSSDTSNVDEQTAKTEVEIEEKAKEIILSLETKMKDYIVSGDMEGPHSEVVWADSNDEFYMAVVNPVEEIMKRLGYQGLDRNTAFGYRESGAVFSKHTLWIRNMDVMKELFDKS